VGLAQVWYKNYHLSNYGISCKARILREINIHSHHTNSPGFEYIYQFASDNRKGRHTKTRFREGTKVSDVIDILVDPENPDWSVPVK